MNATDSLTYNESGLALIDALLDEQQQTTAVERFAQRHDRGELPLHERNYRDLIPLSKPAAGQQYAFEVDLDACSGCKACVTACHNLNGLEDGEVWRSVGVLHGGSRELPVIQHVTTACHHCVDPACLEGCPVNAYDKDPVTGIVRHLDDQCIGCQYCIFKCPYDVPKYSPSKGIVRKCDMCSDRLAEDELPACVQACPSQAIRITLVDQHAVVEESETNHFLPGAPEPGYTLPTTVYKHEKPLPRNLLPADYYSARREHAHWPLVIMLVLTQMSIGAFVVEQVLFSTVTEISGDALGSVRVVHLIAALLLGFLGIGAANFHLGGPLYAFRSIIGLRTSWMSREILAFGIFALTASVYAGSTWLAGGTLKIADANLQFLGGIAALTGVIGVLCSVMIYDSTNRPFWNATATSIKFFGTAFLLGIPMALLISVVSALFSDELTIRQIMTGYGALLCRLLLYGAAVKLLYETLIFTHLRSKQLTPLKRTAMLLTGDLGLTTMKRYAFGIAGGLLLPTLILNESTLTGNAGFSPLFLGAAVLLILVSLLIGELIERYLFFTAVVAPKMPGVGAT